MTNEEWNKFDIIISNYETAISNYETAISNYKKAIKRHKKAETIYCISLIILIINMLLDILL